MSTEYRNALQSVKAILDALLETIKAAGDEGVAGGLLYTALMHHGCPLHRFEQFMGILVESGRVRKQDELYFHVPRPCECDSPPKANG